MEEEGRKEKGDKRRRVQTVGREKEKGEGGKREAIAKRGGRQTGEQGRREKQDKKRRMKTGQ